MLDDLDAAALAQARVARGDGGRRGRRGPDGPRRRRRAFGSARVSRRRSRVAGVADEYGVRPIPLNRTLDP